ncbi:HST3 [Candida jiufengensis]|uniref:HST3 n=1 Tax=Candida jiufengensis TaxID=497108 RepID=UPI002223FAE2|nr:HST3 [Candida jiufengensis]KAI5956500.1 HST3 [Candida jiufengensis]
MPSSSTNSTSIRSIDLINGINSLSSEDHILLNETIKHIFKSKKTTVITGAGISCNAGIPDFRSSDGLYNMIKHKHPKAIVRGQDLFDINLFRDNLSLSIFCTFMESLYKSTLLAKPTETHKFLKHLKDKGKLLRCYTQNIDSLEKNVNLNLGIEISNFEENNEKNCNSISAIIPNKNQKFKENWNSLDVIQLHGNLHKLSCTQCFKNFNWSNEYQTQFNQGLNPECSNCYAKYEERLYSGKRITGNIGILRPDIVLYGENHPQSEILSLGLSNDLKLKPDLLIIMGTSLKVDGVKKLVKSLANEIHKKPNGKVIFVNKTSLSKQWSNFIDYEILCDCDEFIKLLKSEIPDLFLTQEQIDSKKLKNCAKEYIKPINKKSIKIKQESTKIKQEPFSNISIKEEKPNIIKEDTYIKQEDQQSKDDKITIIKEEILTPPVTPTKKQKLIKPQPTTKNPKLIRKRKSSTSSDSEENTSDIENRAKKLRTAMRTPNNSFDENNLSTSFGNNNYQNFAKPKSNLLSKSSTKTKSASQTTVSTTATTTITEPTTKFKFTTSITPPSLSSLTQTLQNIQNLPQDLKRKKNQKMESVSNLLGNILSIEDDESKVNKSNTSTLKTSSSNQSLHQQLQSTPPKKRKSLDLDFSSFWKDGSTTNLKNNDSTTTSTNNQAPKPTDSSQPTDQSFLSSLNSSTNPNYYADKLMEKIIQMIIPNEIYDDQTTKMLKDRQSITLIITHIILKPILITCLPFISLIINTLIPHYLLIYPPDPTFNEEFVETNPFPSTIPLELYKIPKPVPLFSKEFFMNLTDTQNFMKLNILSFDFMIWLTTDYLYFKNEKISSFIVLGCLFLIFVNLYCLPSIIWFLIQHSWIIKMWSIFQVWIFIILMHPKIRSQLLDKVYDENTRLEIQNYVNKVENTLTSILVDENVKHDNSKENIDKDESTLSQDTLKQVEIFELQKLNLRTKIWQPIGFSNQFYTVNTVIRRYNNAIKQLNEQHPLEEIDDETILKNEEDIEDSSKQHHLIKLNKCETLKEIKPPIGYKFLPTSKWIVDFNISEWVESNLIQDLVLIDDDEKWAYDIIIPDEEKIDEKFENDYIYDDDEIYDKINDKSNDEQKIQTKIYVKNENNEKNDNVKIINDDEIYRRRRWLRYVVRENYKDKKQIPVQQSHLASWVT